MVKYVAYYRKWEGIDFRQCFSTPQQVIVAMNGEKDSSFEYFNLCMVCDDGSEEIICSNVDKVKDLK